MVARNAVDGSKLRSIYKSQTFPTTAYGLVYNLKPELAAKIKQAFFDFNWDGTPMQVEFARSTPPEEKFIPINYKEKWQVVRDIDEANGVSYACK
jgi:phosphonate transport system substrate-binding protein